MCSRREVLTKLAKTTMTTMMVILRTALMKPAEIVLKLNVNNNENKGEMLKTNELQEILQGEATAKTFTGALQMMRFSIKFSDIEDSI